MTSSATRRKRRRELQRGELGDRAADRVPSTFARVAETFSDPVLGFHLKRARRGADRYRLELEVPHDPYSALICLTEFQERLLGPVEVALVVELRDFGESWAAIGSALNITGEAARLRYGKRVREVVRDE